MKMLEDKYFEKSGPFIYVKIPIPQFNIKYGIPHYTIEPIYKLKNSKDHQRYFYRFYISIPHHEKLGYISSRAVNCNTPNFWFKDINGFMVYNCSEHKIMTYPIINISAPTDAKYLMIGDLYTSVYTEVKFTKEGNEIL